MTEEEALARLIAIAKEHGDWASEEGHIEADEILLELVSPAIREAYEEIGKWYA